MKKVHPQDKQIEQNQNQWKVIDLECQQKQEEGPLSYKNVNFSPTENISSNRQQIVGQTNPTIASIKHLSGENDLNIPNRKNENPCVQQNKQTQTLIPDKYMAVIFVLSFLLWVALGIYAFEASDPFQKIEKAHNFKENQIVNGLYSVIISFCITFIFGLALQYFLLKNSYKTLVTSLALSIICMIGLTIYSFYQKYIVLGVVSAIFSVLVIAVGLNIYENLRILEKIAELCFQFHLLKTKYLILLINVSIIVLIEIAYSILGVINIIFSLADSQESQRVLIFFGAAYCFLSYWVIGSTINVYCFAISRKCCRWYFSSSKLQEDKNQMQAQRQTVVLNPNENKDKIEPCAVPELKKEIILTEEYNQEDNFKQNKEQCNQNTDQVIEEIEIKNTNQQQSETIFVTIQIALKHIGSITYGGFLSMLFNCISFIFRVLIYASGLVFIFRDDTKSCFQFITRMKIYLSIVRMTYDSSDYCESFKNVCHSLSIKSYHFMFALWGINQITNVTGFFSLIAGFVIGVALIVTIDYNQWYIACLFIFLLFVVVKQGQLLVIANFQMIVYSMITYYDIQKRKKLKQHSEKYKKIQQLLNEAYNRQKEHIDIKEFY